MATSANVAWLHIIMLCIVGVTTRGMCSNPVVQAPQRGSTPAAGATMHNLGSKMTLWMPARDYPAGNQLLVAAAYTTTDAGSASLPTHS